MSLMPTYKQLWEMKYGKPLSPEEAAVEVPAWNALLDRAIRQADRAKDDFVIRAEYQSAVVARDLIEALQSLKSNVTSGAAEGERTAT
jgi:hypothetical protein